MAINHLIQTREKNMRNLLLKRKQKKNPPLNSLLNGGPGLIAVAARRDHTTGVVSSVSVVDNLETKS